MKKVLLITSPRRERWLESDNAVARGLREFSEKVRSLDVELFATSMDRLEFSIDESGVSIRDNYNNCDLREFSLVHLRNIDKSLNLFDYARAVAAYVRSFGGKLVEEEDDGMALGKLSQMVIFRLNNLPVPKTLACWDNETLARMARTLSFPLIVKANNGMKGSENYLVRGETELSEALKNFSQQFVVQEFIPNDGDYRVLFAGQNVQPLIFKRSAIEGSHLSNTSKGSEATVKTADELGEGLEIARAAATAVHRTVTGIDLMKNSATGDWVLLEANVNPALSMGAFLDTKVALYAKMVNERLGE